MRTSQRQFFPLLFAAVLAVGGCASGGAPNSIADFERTVSPQPLDVPPGLSVPAGTDLMQIPQVQGGRQAPVLPQPEMVRLGRSGSMRWLVIEAPPAQVWPEVKSFFREQGFALQIDRPQIGILETGWLENRADIPTGFIQGAISQVLPAVYSAPTRDKFRVRLERGAKGNTTEVYLTHYGREQVSHGEQDLRWQRRPVDTELVNEMLHRLLVHIGVPSAQATTLVEQAGGAAEPRARLQGDTLILDESFARAWRRVGVALDRIGLKVQDRNRSDGVYFVRYTEQLAAADGQGWFSGWFSDEVAVRPRDFRIRLNRGGEATRVRLESADGTLPPEQRRELLSRLRDELR